MTIIDAKYFRQSQRLRSATHKEQVRLYDESTYGFHIRPNTYDPGGLEPVVFVEGIPPLKGEKSRSYFARAQSIMAQLPCPKCRKYRSHDMTPSGAAIIHDCEFCARRNTLTLTVLLAAIFVSVSFIVLWYN